MTKRKERIKLSKLKMQIFGENVTKFNSFILDERKVRAC